MTPLRPLVLQPDASPYGANRALLRAIVAMPAGSVSPVVVFPYEGSAVGEYEEAGCEVRIEPMAVLRRSSAGLPGLLRLARARRRTGHLLAGIARRMECDLVHTNSMTIVSGAVAARQARVPHVWQLREAPRERGLRAWVLRRLLRRAALVVAVSEAAAGLAPSGAVVVRDGYDAPPPPGDDAARIAEPGELLVGMVGRISPSKAPHVLVEALGDGMRGVIAGTVYPGYEQYAQAQVVDRSVELGNDGRLAVLGWIEDAAPLMRQLDVLLIATATGEGFPGSVLEALAHGVPVVSCATGGVAELVVDDVTGIECAPGDVAAVASALRRLRDDPQLRARLGAGGREHAARFTVRRSAEDLLAAWRSVLT